MRQTPSLRHLRKRLESLNPKASSLCQATCERRSWERWKIWFAKHATFEHTLIDRNAYIFLLFLYSAKRLARSSSKTLFGVSPLRESYFATLEQEIKVMFSSTNDRLEGLLACSLTLKNNLAHRTLRRLDPLAERKTNRIGETPKSMKSVYVPSSYHPKYPSRLQSPSHNQIHHHTEYRRKIIFRQNIPKISPFGIYKT